VAQERRAILIVLRVFIAHALAYPIAMLWSLGSLPVIIVSVASTRYDDAEIARRVLVSALWPLVGSFVLAHAPGAAWAWSRGDVRAGRVFVTSMALLGAVPVVVGGALWVWLVLR
jgi:hypothetical protein